MTWPCLRRCSTSGRRKACPSPACEAGPSFETLSERSGSRYLHFGLDLFTALSDCRVDLAFSNAVLEHVCLDEFVATLAWLHRVIGPHGVCSHTLDLRTTPAERSTTCGSRRRSGNLACAPNLASIPTASATGRCSTCLSVRASWSSGFGLTTSRPCRLRGSRCQRSFEIMRRKICVLRFLTSCCGLADLRQHGGHAQRSEA